MHEAAMAAPRPPQPMGDFALKLGRQGRHDQGDEEARDNDHPHFQRMGAGGDEAGAPIACESDRADYGLQNDQGKYAQCGSNDKAGRKDDERHHASPSPLRDGSHYPSERPRRRFVPDKSELKTTQAFFLPPNCMNRDRQPCETSSQTYRFTIKP